MFNSSSWSMIEFRRNVEDPCLFSTETKNSNHLFFVCVVVVQMWAVIYQAIERSVGVNFESINTYWFSTKKITIVNMLRAAVFWSLWKLRNDLCFHNADW
ncbi:hypothetical protein PVAP13_6NG119700 [Panicum virgatum]|jgi:hypothetical protein|uniref:Reverse transcriptase zinc-binding domain-containing protein n=1 Tax=Panicum virgatum TaxID=38727 RepID=A0A8T0QZ10_PANVG|nr:hypothetical protein PVAP13_6NG119700 [Panicum virgatum]